MFVDLFVEINKFILQLVTLANVNLHLLELVLPVEFVLLDILIKLQLRAVLQFVEQTKYIIKIQVNVFVLADIF
jgi:hypothetical protein